MLDRSEFLSNLLSTLVGVLVGGVISVVFGYKLLNMQLNHESAVKKYEFTMDIASFKHPIYTDFFNDYGDITQVIKMSKEDWYKLNNLIGRLNLLGDKEVAKLLVEFYREVGVLKFNEKLGRDNKQGRNKYYEILKKITNTMSQSLGVISVSSIWITDPEAITITN